MKTISRRLARKSILFWMKNLLKILIANMINKIFMKKTF